MAAIPLILVACVALLAACGRLPGAGSSRSDSEGQPAHMVETQIRARGIKHPDVLAAMRVVPRDRFVPPAVRAQAFEDTPLPIGFDQTISQPFIVGYMTEAIEPVRSDRVLEIGTGSGYQAAVLAEIGCEVYSIEIIPELAERARATLGELGYTRVHVRHGNGYLGWPEAAPFSKIIVTAAPEELPQALVDQLAVGGIMVVPVGRMSQMMTIVRRMKEGVVSRETIPVMFVPMIKK